MMLASSWLAGPGLQVEMEAQRVAYKLDNWPKEVILQLASCARYNLYPDALLMRRIRSLTTLLPSQEIGPLTVAELKRHVPIPESRLTWPEEKWAAFVAYRKRTWRTWSDEELEAIWPARTKMDLSIRRTRLRDTYTAYKLCGLESQFWERCIRIGPFDVISVTNFLNADLLLSTDDWSWFGFWDDLGAFSAGVAHWGAVASYVSNLAKKRVCQGFDRMRVSENGVLTGFRNPPFPGFNEVVETQKLAEAGETVHGLVECDSLREFRSLCDRVLMVPGPYVKWVSFFDFVKSGDWETAGSSSEGVVDWEMGEESGHFKARKNLVPDVVNLDELARACLETNAQINKAVKKSELGKVRMAVASDLYTYLKMSWITRLLGGRYATWHGCVLDETIREQGARLCQMWKRIKKSWNLPFDYAGFDHQPTTQELKIMSETLVRMAKQTVMPEHMAEFEDIAANVVSGFDHSTLSVRTETGNERVFKVTGGLMSGLRWTSIMGNAWNSVMTSWVLQVLEKLGVPSGDIDRWILGDDSAVSGPSYVKILLVRQLYEAIGAKGSDGKFGIHQGESEFLRVWYNASGCRGYAVRSIPALTQRKPWSSAPWDEESSMSAVWSAVSTIRRRLGGSERLDRWWAAVKRCWSQRKHVSTNWLQIPKSMGGLGVEPWDSKTFPLKPWPRVNKLSVRVLNQTGWRAEKLEEQYQPILPINHVQAQLLADKVVAEKIASDDVPAVNSVFHKMSKSPKSSRVERRPVPWNVPAVQALRTACRLVGGFSTKSKPFDLVDRTCNTGTYGRFRGLRDVWNKVSDLYRVEKKTGVLRWFESRYPEFWTWIKHLEGRGLARWEALDWAFGSFGINILRELHPSLTGLIHKAAVHVGNGFVLRTKLRPRQLSQLVTQASSLLESWLAQSNYASTLYRW
jgi:hypothetical protein